MEVVWAIDGLDRQEIVAVYQSGVRTTRSEDLYSPGSLLLWLLGFSILQKR